jgi:hypothetical protein
VEKLHVTNMFLHVPDDGSDELKHVTCCITLKCCACILCLYSNIV